MYHLRLCKGLSYSGVVSATKREPDIFVKDEPTAAQAVATGFFQLVEGSDKAPAPKAPSGTITALDTMTGAQLKKYAEEKGIDIKGLTRVDDIRARVIEADAALGEDDPAGQFVGGANDEDEDGGASE